MKKINVKLIVSIALIIFMIAMLTTTTFADVDPAQRPDYYDPKANFDSNGTFVKKASMVLGWIQYIGIILLVIVLAIIGINYMLSSVEGKAEYKKKILPYVLGCCLLMAISVFIGIIQNVASDSTTPVGGGGGGTQQTLEVK